MKGIVILDLQISLKEEYKLFNYDIDYVSYEILKIRFPIISRNLLYKWINNKKEKFKALDYFIRWIKLNEVLLIRN